MKKIVSLLCMSLVLYGCSYNDGVAMISGTQEKVELAKSTDEKEMFFKEVEDAFKKLDMLNSYKETKSLVDYAIPSCKDKQVEIKEQTATKVTSVLIKNQKEEYIQFQDITMKDGTKEVHLYEQYRDGIIEMFRKKDKDYEFDTFRDEPAGHTERLIADYTDHKFSKALNDYEVSKSVKDGDVVIRVTAKKNALNKNESAKKERLMLKEGECSLDSISFQDFAFVYTINKDGYIESVLNYTTMMFHEKEYTSNSTFDYTDFNKITSLNYKDVQ